MAIAIVLHFAEELNAPLGITTTKRNVADGEVVRVRRYVHVSIHVQKREVFLSSFGSSTNPPGRESVK